MSELIDSARNHCNVSIEDAWKEFERTGEISNSAELIINAAEFYKKYAQEADVKITQLEKDKAELVELLECMVISYSEKDSYDYSPLPADEQDSDMKDAMELLERMK